jgi:ELWxxDGT repeat protein
MFHSIQRILNHFESLFTQRICSRRNRVRGYRTETLEQRQLLSADFQLVRDINSSFLPDGSSPNEYVAVGPTTFFSATTGLGTELWKTDGTAAGTKLVKDIREGVGSSAPANLTNFNGAVYFAAYGGTTFPSYGLWKSDGTAAGTVLVKSVSRFSTARFTVVGSTLYFAAESNAKGIELWKSDGTTAGTSMVKDIDSGEHREVEFQPWGVETTWKPNSSLPDKFTNVGGTLYFTATDGSAGRELWKSNGTEAGTLLVKDLAPGTREEEVYLPYGGSYNKIVANGSSISEMINFGGTLYFTADDGAAGKELWKTNGTAAGTTIVKDVQSGAGSSSPSNLTIANALLYFSADDGVVGTELWKSNGTPAGTTLVSNIRTGVDGSSPSNLTNIGGELYFSADDGISGTELWRSNGSAVGTTLVRNIRNGIDGSSPNSLTNVGGVLYFSADDGIAGIELWKSNGTAAGTVIVKNLNAGSGSSYPFRFANINGVLLFSADDGTTGQELVLSNGTANGTVLINIEPENGVSSHPGEFANASGELYFSAYTGTSGLELWKSDGTATGTVLVKDIFTGSDDSSPRDLTTVGEVVFFSANDGTNGIELWKTNGTAAGTMMVKNIRSGIESSYPGNFTNVGGVLYFTADNGANGRELWKSDGTAAGTVMIKDITVGSGSPYPTQLANHAGVLYFTANNTEIWRSNGTAAGTILVKEIGSRGNAKATGPGGLLYFLANSNSGGNQELWRTDGTSTGTFAIKSWGEEQPFNSNTSRRLIVVGNTLFFTAYTATGGEELWKSDGTVSGTVLVKDIYPGTTYIFESNSTEPNSATPTSLTNVNGELYFIANDSVSGNNLWQTDGTDAGTVKVTSAYQSSNSMHAVGSKLFASIFTEEYGSELYLANLVKPVTTIDLASLVAGQGTTIFGADPSDSSGRSVSNAGDVNGDGFDDLIVGAPYADQPNTGNSNQGESYVIFGGESPPATIDLANLGSAGITFTIGREFSNLGVSVSSAGDVNGDGFGDLLVGGGWFFDFGFGGNDRWMGFSYLIFGGASLPSTMAVGSRPTDITISPFQPESMSDYGGYIVSSAGDVNGDGFDDLFVGDRNESRSYVIFGGTTLSSHIDPTSLGSAGITISGVGHSHEVSTAGDVNGDGFDDLIIGNRNANRLNAVGSNHGESYLIYGSASPPATINVANLGSAGITIFGAEAFDQSGGSVSSAGDVNGDGFSDLIIGAPGADASGNSRSDAGESYLIFGGPSLPTTIDLASLGLIGITMFGADADDASGFSVNNAGDVNGDGFDDLIIGASSADAVGNAKLSAGESYLIFGGTSLPATIDLRNPGAAGITIFGVDGSDFSGTVSTAGDVNGDGFDELLVGAPGADAAGNAKIGAGESYLVLGGNFTAAVTHAGTAAAETLTGNASANVMVGGRGNDTLIGNGGADVLQGGQGNDVLAVSSTTFKRVLGGTGTDTLRLDGSGLLLDLTTLMDNRIVDIETIDLTGSGNNTLNLNHWEVLNISGNSNTLLVKGNTGDRVLLDGGWSRGAGEVISSITYRVMTKGAATLKVADTVLVQMLGPVNGTDGNDTFVLTYSGSAPTGTVSVTNSTSVGAAIDLGTFPMDSPLNIDGLGGTDSVLVVGTSGNDSFVINSSTGLKINGAGLVLSGIEQRTLAGGAGNDAYTFDADAALGLFTLNEAGGGMDTIDFSLTTTVHVSVNLSTAPTQVVHATNLSLILGSTSTFEDIIGGSGNDTITGNALANDLNGGPGNDTLNGAAGHDTLVGGHGNDTYSFTAATSAGNTIISELGTTGVDTINFSSITSPTGGVSVNLGLTAFQRIDALRFLRIDGASAFENVIGGSGNDTITGNALPNNLNGGPGNDTLNGVSGSDTLIGGHGNDIYSFGASTAAGNNVISEVGTTGVDTITFSSITSPTGGVSINLGLTTFQRLDALRFLRIDGASAFENVTGGSGNDTITGNALANNLNGGSGNDTLNGVTGSDTLVGGHGNDTYSFMAASSAGNNVISEVGTAGVDIINFSSITSPTGGVSVNLGLTAFQRIDALRFLRIDGASAFENVIGGSGNDTITGNTLANNLNGGPGNDTLNGATGHDTLVGGHGNDTYSFMAATSAGNNIISEVGTTGIDTINFSSITSPTGGVSVNLSLTAFQRIDGLRFLRIDGASDFENVIGGSGNDTITGNALANNLNGGPGNDTLNGVAGSDTLVGGHGDDTYEFGPVSLRAEADSVTEYAGQGLDKLNFASVSMNVTVSLGSTSLQAVHIRRTLKLNSPSTLENLTGGSGNDTLRGNSLANFISGGSGNDLLAGATGSDFLSGDAGNDKYEFSATSNDVDTLFDSGGEDTIDMHLIASSITLNLGTTASQTVHTNRRIILKSISFENAIGGSSGDHITGNSLKNNLLGGGGNDVLVGGSGDDLLNGGSGNDSLWGDGGNDILIAIDNGTGDTLNSGTGLDALWVDQTGSFTDKMNGNTKDDLVQLVALFENTKDRTLNGDQIIDPAAVDTTDRVNFSHVPLYSARGPLVTDVVQNALGDCYFLAGLAAVARDNALAIKRNIVDFGDGTFGVRFANKFYRVDADLPVAGRLLEGESPLYAQIGANTHLWVAIAEKAFAHHRHNQNSYGSIVSGTADEVNKAFRASSTGLKGFSMYRTASLMANEIYNRWRLSESVCVGFGGDETKKEAAKGIPIILNHAYTVTRVIRDNLSGVVTSIELRNPWGQDGFSGIKGDDNDSPNDDWDGLVRVTPDELWRLRSVGYITWGKV